MATKHDLPVFSEYFYPTVSALKARGGSATIDELEQDVSEALHLSDDVLAVPHGDSARSQFQYELAWVRTYLKKVGAVENSERGVWSLTPIGAAMTKAELREVPRRVRAETRRIKQTIEAEGDSEEPIESEGSSEEAEIVWKEHLTDSLLSISSDAFERLCQRLLRESGFTKVEVTGRSGDGGIDGIGVLRVQLVSFHVLFKARDGKPRSAQAL